MADFASTIIDGIQFSFPIGWQVEHSEDERGRLASLDGPSATFSVVGVYPKEEDPEDVVEQTIESLRDEHPGLELEDAEDEEWNEHITSEQVCFMSVDTVSYCRIRSWRMAEKTVVVFTQFPEREAKIAIALHQAICASAKNVKTIN